MIPLYFRAYYNPCGWSGDRVDDQPHGILKIVSRCTFWFKPPGASEFYVHNVKANSMAEMKNFISYCHENVKFIKISKAEYDTYRAFDLFPEYKIKYKPMMVTFEKRWLHALLVIFFVHLAIILLGIPMGAASSVEENNQQVLIATGSWLIFSAGALCCWLIDSFAYWRRIRRGLTTPSSRA